MLFQLSCVLLLSMSLGVLADEPQTCMEGMCPMDEGLELLQSKAGKVIHAGAADKHDEAKAETQQGTGIGKTAELNEAGYQTVAALNDAAQMQAYIHRVVDSMNMEVRDWGGLHGMVPYYSGENAVQSLKKMQNELKQVASDAKGFRWVKKQEIEFEESLLEEKDIQKARFRGRHANWTDILEFYSDGFFIRYHDHDAGIWHLNKKNELVLAWLQWPEESIESKDGGKSFNATSNDNNFYMKGYTQPFWWHKQFDGTNDAYLQFLQDQPKTHAAKEKRMREVLKAHANGNQASLDEKGYAAVAMQKDDDEMETYIRRVVESMDMDVINNGGLKGLLPYYSGRNTWQTFKKLVAEIQASAQRRKGDKGVKWTKARGEIVSTEAEEENKEKEEARGEIVSTEAEEEKDETEEEEEEEEAEEEEEEEEQE